MSRSAPLLLLYAFTLFVSALLLFLVQPLIGKLIVPLLGGFPAVWNTCMVFFQAVLLAGYAYAHFSTQWLGERRQAALHLIVLLLPLVVLPLGVFTSLVPAGEDNPVPGLLLMLGASAGLPFFAVSATAPLLQRWFAGTDHPAAKDPYFLYAASNLGSMIGLLGYPLLLEPALTLPQQRWAWSVGYGLLGALIALCAVLLWRSRPPSAAVEAKSAATAPISWSTIARWVALGAVPSSLMLGATTYITTDVAAIPLLWVLPLTLYLLSFIIVFARVPKEIHTLMVLAQPLVLVILLFFMSGHLAVPMGLQILLHLTALFVVAMVCHGELARTRPPAKHLTRFFLWMSFGGVVGGLFNALLAPVVFSSLAEYPLALVAAGMLRPPTPADADRSFRVYIRDLLFLLGVTLFTVEGIYDFLLTRPVLTFLQEQIQPALPKFEPLQLIKYHGALSYAAITLGPALLLTLLVAWLRNRRVCFGLCMGVFLLVTAIPNVTSGRLLYRDRSFFGTLAVYLDDSTETKPWWEVFLFAKPAEDEGPQSGHTRLRHGNILHGVQDRDPDNRRQPMTYFHADGPVGQLFQAARDKHARMDVAILGLGTGTLATYAKTGDRVVFYEIDRHVKTICYDRPTYFSYISDAKERGVDLDIILGDGRLRIDQGRIERPEEKYDLIFLDAFTSDAIPVHLLTKEALEIYLDRLKPDGIIVFHTTNRYVDISPVLANLAAARKEPLSAITQHDEESDMPWRSPTSWVLLARRPEDFGALLKNEHWTRPDGDPAVGVWSDDYSNLLRVFNWRGE